MLPLAAGELFHGRFEVVRSISKGGVGAVYEVRDERTGRRRALKVLLPMFAIDEDARERLSLEARITGNLRSRHVVEVVDAGCDETSGCPYVVMDLLDGESLGALLARGPVPVGTALDVLRQTALGLDALHGAGVIHRDVKPENVVVTREPDGALRACLVDLGVAKVARSGAAPTTRALGTPLYMAPEQIEGVGDLDGRADVYSLGHLAFTLLVGRAYFDDEHRRGALYRVLLDATRGLPEAAHERAVRLGGELPPGFDAWFEEVTARDRQRRPPTAGEAVRRLDACLAGVTATSRRVSRTVMTGAALVGLALVAASSFPKRQAPVRSVAVAVVETPEPSHARPAATVISPVPDTVATVAQTPAPLAPARQRPRASSAVARPAPSASAGVRLPSDPTDLR